MSDPSAALGGRDHAPRRRKILFAGQSLADPSGGGELSARALLVALSEHHDVEALLLGRVEKRYEIGGRVRCRDVATRWLPSPAGMPFHLSALLAERSFGASLAARLDDPPDVLVLQQPAWVRPSALPEGTKVVTFLRSLACYGVGEANPSVWRRTLSRPFGALRFGANRPLLERSDLLITNSVFLQGAVARSRGLSSEVVPPFIDTEALSTVRRDESADRIVFVGLDEWKGARLALRIARALPDRRFLFLDGARPSRRMIAEAERLPHVSRAPWTDDMGAVFRQARLLLMPSLWEEPFGRLPVEAGSMGIPTLASDRGGLPESTGPGGRILEALHDPEPWVRAIREMDEPGRYAALSEAARVHASGLALDITLRRFRDVVRLRTGLDL